MEAMFFSIACMNVLVIVWIFVHAFRLHKRYVKLTQIISNNATICEQLRQLKDNMFRSYETEVALLNKGLNTTTKIISLMKEDKNMEKLYMNGMEVDGMEVNKESQPMENNFSIGPNEDAEQLIKDAIAIEQDPNEMTKEELVNLVLLLCKMIAKLNKDK